MIKDILKVVIFLPIELLMLFICVIEAILSCITDTWIKFDEKYIKFNKSWRRLFGKVGK